MLERPPLHVARLTPEFKWEVTRRHPQYIQLWNVWVAAERAGCLDWVRQDPLFRRGRLSLQVVGSLLDPSLEFEELPGSESSELLSTAIRQLDIRQHAVLLARVLSVDSLRFLSEHFARVAFGKEHNFVTGLGFIAQMLDADGPKELDKSLDVPFYEINPIASQSQSNAEISAAKEKWRKRLDLEIGRDRSDAYARYLRAWDLREGWADGRYDRAEARQLSDVATVLEASPNTARNWYTSGFKLIFGHEFSPDDWRAAMGVQHVASLLGEEPSAIMLERILRAAASNPETVDETTLTKGEGGLLKNVPAPEPADQEQLTTQQLLDEIHRLLEEGRDDAEILSELNLGDQAQEAIAFLRESPGHQPQK